MREIVIGTRVECDGCRGTVLFTGEVPPTKGTWLGVEWDDPSRGKHDGCHDGKRYFTTRKRNAGSFIRMNKLSPTITFCDALRERYLKSSTEGFADHVLINDLKDEMNAPFLELVGFEKIGRKQSKLDELKIAVLDRMRIIDAEDNLVSICPMIEELDISSNLFNSWETIAYIAQQLPNLKILNLSDNQLSIPEDPKTLQSAFASLMQLALGNMDYTWAEIVKCSSMWPHVENLSVPNNRITQLEFMNNDVFPELRVLNLEGNQLESWEEINKLGQLPCLEQLSLYGCGLQNIQVKEGSFLRLSKLSLSNNKITEWRHISELNKCPNLTELKISNNEGLHVNSYETFSQWVIARIETLKVLNGSRITSEDRRGAELDYLKHHGKEFLHIMVSDDREAKLKELLYQHPRYLKLVEKYGPPEQGELEGKPATLKSNLIGLKLQKGSKTITKKLPATMEVQKLKTLCHRLFNVDASELLLFCHSSKNPDVNMPLDNDLRSLSFYSLEDGDVVLLKTL